MTSGDISVINYDIMTPYMSPNKRPATSTARERRGGRTYSSALRKRQKDLARESVLRALAEIVAEGDLLAFTVQDVADRAGVSHRSLYRHFPTRKALLEGLYDWGEAQLDVPNVVGFPASVDMLPHMAGTLFALFETRPAWIRAAAIASIATDIQPKTRLKRNAALEKMVSGITPNLRRDESRRAFAVLRYLISSHAWLILREQFGLHGGEAGKAVAWALRALVEDLKRRNAKAARDGPTGAGGHVGAQSTVSAKRRTV